MGNGKWKMEEGRLWLLGVFVVVVAFWLCLFLFCLLDTFLWVKPQNGGSAVMMIFICFLCFVFRRSKVSSIYFMASHSHSRSFFAVALALQF